MSAVPKTKLLQCEAARGLDLAFVSVLITATVTSLNLPTSLGIKKGDKVEMSFLTLPMPTDRLANDDSGVHMMDGLGTYPICNETFSLTVGSLKASMGDALPATEFLPQTTETFLTVVEKRPVYDGLYITPGPRGLSVASLPLTMTGPIKGLYLPAWNLNFNVGFERGTFPMSMLSGMSSAKVTDKGVISSSFSLSTSFASNIVLEASFDSVEWSSAKTPN